ncbi:MAG: ribose-5-phosphate isomerase RpiA [Pseudomonadota bacterium]
MSELLKAKAGEAALQWVEDGMKLGIGTGSTAEAFVHALAGAVNDGLDVVGVPTSERTRSLCQDLGIALTTLEDTPHLDLTIDGADEVDPALNLIKGGGGALLREKIVACASDEMLVIADDSKMVDHLGRFPLPIEVNPFGLKATTMAIEQVSGSFGLSGPLNLRALDDGQPFITDGGHYIIDASFGRIDDPTALAQALVSIPGVVEHGLFTGIATRVILAGDGGIQVLQGAN